MRLRKQTWIWLSLGFIYGGSATAQERPPMASRPAYSGNRSRRPAGAKIKYIVIHTIEGSASSAINWFRNPRSRVSAHFVVAKDGAITETVAEHLKAWHAGRYNGESFGIEHEGHADRNTWTDAQYRASARLSRYLCAKYNIPKTRKNIVGHIEVPGATHHDPGRYFNWDYYMRLVRGDEVPTLRAERPTGNQFVGRSDLSDGANRRGLTLRWAVGEGTVSGYRVLLRQGDTTVFDSGHKVGSATRFELPLALEHGRSYSWKVRIVGENNRSRESEWQAFRVDLTPPKIEVLYPPDGATVDSTPGLRWRYTDNESKQVSYRIWLDDDADHSRVIGDTLELNGDQGIYFIKSRLVPGKVYHWRVMGYDGRGNVALSSWQRFKLDENGVDMVAAGVGVRLLSPRDDAMVAPGTRPLLRWRYYSAENRPQKGVRILLDGDADHTRIDYDSGHQAGSGSGFRAPLNFEPGRRYYWKVRAWDGESSFESGWTSFIFGAPTTLTGVRPPAPGGTSWQPATPGAASGDDATRSGPGVRSNGLRGALSGGNRRQ